MIFVRELVEGGKATKEELAEIEAEVKGIIDQAVKFALASPYPEPEEALRDVFA